MANFDGYTVILLSSTAESTVWFGAVVGGFGARVWVVLKFPFANWLPLMSDATRTLCVRCSDVKTTQANGTP